MRLLYRRCAGLDVHKKSISACIRIRSHRQKVETLTAEFGTFTEELERLRDWLKQNQVKQVAMESTGVYWMPVWNVLEAGSPKLALMLINPQHVKALPGRKTDQSDCQRIAELLQYGLLRASFIPPQPIRELRELTRRRVHLQHDRNRVINRIRRLLETANVKLGSVISDIAGRSGLSILQAIASGQSDPEKLADYKVGHLKATRQELVLSLNGRYSDHFRWLLWELLDELQRLDQKVAELDARTVNYIRPHLPIIQRLCTIPGVDYLSACVLVAELGPDMSVFPNADHLASWAGLCPGNCESAGKRQSGRTRKGARYLRRLLIQNAWGVTKMKDCFLTAVFYRVAARRGLKKAALAVAHKILVIAYHLIRDGVTYQDPGGDYFDRRNPERLAKRLARRLERIGYQVVRKSMPAFRDSPSAPGVSRPHISLEEASGCSKCARWGVPCIHARNRKPTPRQNPSHSEHSG